MRKIRGKKTFQMSTPCETNYTIECVFVTHDQSVQGFQLGTFPYFLLYMNI